MIRPILQEFVLFLLPFLAYAVFLIATRARVFDAGSWPVGRIASLSIIALLLVVASFVVLAHRSGAPPGSTYVPAHIEDGRLVPGENR